MIAEITKKKWYLHLRQTKVISVAGYPEFSNDIYISTFTNFREPRFLTISGQLDKANPNLRDHLEYELAQYLVDMHNASLEPKKEELVKEVIKAEEPAVETKKVRIKKPPTEKQLAHYKKMNQANAARREIMKEQINEVPQSNGSNAPPEQDSIQVTGSEVQKALSPSSETSQSNHEGGLFKA